MNRTLEEGTGNKYHDETHDTPKEHLQCFIDAPNFGKRLKALKGLAVFDNINKHWNEQPDKFKTNSVRCLHECTDFIWTKLLNELKI